MPQLFRQIKLNNPFGPRSTQNLWEFDFGGYMFTSHRTIKWIENLAEQEVSIRAGERSSIDLGNTKDEVLAVETATFVRELYYHFDYLVQLFNQRLNQPGLDIRLLKHGDSLESFSLARNGMRLLLVRPQAGVVQFQCEKMNDDNPSGITVRGTLMFSGLVEGQFGSFHDVEWYFLGAKITAEQLARHYLTEFIQQSRKKYQA